MNADSWVKPVIKALSDDQLDVLHEASLKILSETGVNVHSSAVRRLLKEAGAVVRDDLRVHISPALVDQALRTAPPRIDVYDRRGKVAMALEGVRCYFGTGSDLEYTIDFQTRQRRESVLADVARSARVCDKLPNIDFVMSYALPRDVGGQRCEIEQFRAMLDNTAKPVIMTAFSGREALERMHRLACERCGGDSAFCRSPNYLMYGQFVSPLQHDAGALERLLFCADHAVPLIYVPTIMMGASGPVTLAGSLALANAECLAGLVMHQLRAPGSPFIYGGCISPLDMRTTVYAYNSPEWRLADVVLSQFSLRYHLPVFGTGGVTDAKTIDAQSGAEWAYSLMISALAGTNLIHDVGYMESGLTGCLEALVICDEIVGMVKRVVDGFEISPETLALDVINRVGPAGHFMEEGHTLAHFRKAVWYPSLFERERFDTWRAGGGKDVLQRARDRVEKLLE